MGARSAGEEQRVHEERGVAQLPGLSRQSPGCGPSPWGLPGKPAPWSPPARRPAHCAHAHTLALTYTLTHTCRRSLTRYHTLSHTRLHTQPYTLTLTTPWSHSAGPPRQQVQKQPLPGCRASPPLVPSPPLPFLSIWASLPAPAPVSGSSLWNSRTGSSGPPHGLLPSLLPSPGRFGDEVAGGQGSWGAGRGARQRHGPHTVGRHGSSSRMPGPLWAKFIWGGPGAPPVLTWLPTTSPHPAPPARMSLPWARVPLTLQWRRDRSPTSVHHSALGPLLSPSWWPTFWVLKDTLLCSCAGRGWPGRGWPVKSRAGSHSCTHL